MKLAGMLSTPLRWVHVALFLVSLLLKLSLVLYLFLCIVGESWMVLALSTLLLAALLIATIVQALAWLLVTVLFTLVQLSIVYGMVWLVVKATELVLTPCGLSTWVQPVSRGLFNVVRLIWSTVLRTLGPLVAMGLKAVGGGSQAGTSSTEQAQEEEVDFPTSQTAPDSLSLQLQPKSSRYKNVEMPPSALRQRISSTLQSSWQADNQEEEEELCRSWSASFRAESLRRISVRFAHKIEEYVEDDERESAKEGVGDACDDVDGHSAKDIQMEDDGYSPGDELSGFDITGRCGIGKGENRCRSLTSEESDSEPISHSDAAPPHPSTRSKEKSSLDAVIHRGSLTRAKVSPKEAAEPRVKTIFQVLVGAFVLTLFLTHNWTALLFVLMVAWIMVKSVMGGLVEACLGRVWSSLQMVADSNIPSPVKKLYLLLDRKVCVMWSVCVRTYLHVLCVCACMRAYVRAICVTGINTCTPTHLWTCTLFIR